MSNVQTGAERMPHDLSHLGFVAGQIGLICKPPPSVCRINFPSLDCLLVRLVVLLPFYLPRLSRATPSRCSPFALSGSPHCVVPLLLTLLKTFLLFMSLIVTF